MRTSPPPAPIAVRIRMYDLMFLPPIGGDALLRDLHRLDHSLLVEVQLVDAHRAMIAIGLPERAAVIDDVPVGRAVDVENGVVASARRDRRVLLQNLADTL